MRSISGMRNRTMLVLGGLAALGCSAWLAIAYFNLTAAWSWTGTSLPAPSATPGGLLGTGKILPLVLCVTLVLLDLAVALGLLASQIPRRTRAVSLQVAAKDRTSLGTVDSEVVDRALKERVEALTGVTDASVHVSGATQATWVQARVTIAQDAQISWVIEQVRERLSGDLTTAFGAQPRQVDLLVQLRAAKAASSSAAVLRGTSGRRQAADLA